MKNLLRNLDMPLSNKEKESIKGIMARVTEPVIEGDKLQINLLVYTGDSFPKKQHSFIVNYPGKCSPQFLEEIQHAQKKGYKLEVEGTYIPGFGRRILGQINAEKLSILPKQDL
jgi:hypothetical protein